MPHRAGQIAANRARAGVWNANASVDFLAEQHAINGFLASLTSDQRQILAALLEEEFVSGVHDTLRVLHEMKVLFVLLLVLTGCSQANEAFTGSRSVDTTKPAVEEEGYTSELSAVDWLLVESSEDELVVVSAGGGCSDFNGYRLHQTSSKVVIDIINTVRTPKGLPYVCTSNFKATRQTIPLPEKLGSAEVSGGCPPERTQDEGRWCSNLRRMAERFE